MLEKFSKNMSIFSGDLTEMIFYTKRELMKLSSPRSVFIKEGNRQLHGFYSTIKKLLGVN